MTSTVKKAKGAVRKAATKHPWKSQWKKLIRKIDEAKRESSRLFSLSKRRYQKALRDLERKRRELDKNLQQFGTRSDLAWHDVKSGFRAAAKRVDHAVTKAMAELRAAPNSGRRRR
jgi:hypothetical protein